MWLSMDRAQIASAIRKNMQSRIPGFYEIMEINCRRTYGKSCIDLFFDEPEKLRDILFKRYGSDTTSIYFIVKYLLLRPVLVEKNRLDLEEELATTFLNNPSEFKKIMGILLQR